jgi:hypothetical protein
VDVGRVEVVVDSPVGEAEVVVRDGELVIGGEDTAVVSGPDEELVWVCVFSPA